MNRSPIRYLLLTLVIVAIFQSAATAQDSILLLSESQFMESVRRHHPVAKQAALQVAEAKAGVLASRGNFDPVVSVDVDRKVFNEKDYFNYLNGMYHLYLEVTSNSFVNIVQDFIYHNKNY